MSHVLILVGLIDQLWWHMRELTVCGLLNVDMVQYRFIWWALTPPPRFLCLINKDEDVAAKYHSHFGHRGYDMDFIEIPFFAASCWRCLLYHVGLESYRSIIGSFLLTNNSIDRCIYETMRILVNKGNSIMIFQERAGTYYSDTVCGLSHN